jgi:hypothetical protein
MRYFELNIFGVYVSPMSVMLVVAWVMLIVIRRIADRAGLSQRLWHPALANLAIYVILLSAIIVAVGEIG